MHKIMWHSSNSLGAYEVSTKGDKRFSALNAVMPDGRTIEMWYQCDVKGYNPGGVNWKLGKGKEPQMPYAEGELYQAYKALWRIWAANNTELMYELAICARQHDYALCDCFARTPINQARALSEILNEWIL